MENVIIEIENNIKMYQYEVDTPANSHSMQVYYKGKVDALKDLLAYVKLQ